MVVLVLVFVAFVAAVWAVIQLPLAGKLSVVAALAMVVWLAIPALEGYHIGCNTLSGDNVTQDRLGIQWCKHDASQPSLP